MRGWESGTQVKTKRNRATGQKATIVPKTVLDTVSGVANPGQLLSVMGPSGGGKTSILNVLAGRITPAMGSVLLNGQRLPRNFNRIAAYVMQDDLLAEMLTPRELFRFAANLRLAQMSAADRYSRVEYLIKTLGLSHCANTRVGRPLQRGLSGGERKRTSIGYELVTNPSLIFLDEPTSGLDRYVCGRHAPAAPGERGFESKKKESRIHPPRARHGVPAWGAVARVDASYTAYSVIELLKKLAAQGRTIVCTIHQPSSEIFALFDRLMLLSGGRVAYSGKATDAMQYFDKQGMPCPTYSNPADFFMRILHNHSAEDRARVDSIVAYYRTYVQQNAGAAAVGLIKQDSSELLGKELAETAETVLTEVSKPMPGPGSMKEIMYLSQRAFTTLVRNPITLHARLAQNILMAVIAGLIYYDIGNTQTAMQDRIGVLFFITMSQVCCVAARRSPC